MRPGKIEPRRLPIRLENGARAEMAVRDPQKTSLFAAPLSHMVDLLTCQVLPLLH
jgi:hypothetical protein